jgi:hypothetical protein
MRKRKAAKAQEGELLPAKCGVKSIYTHELALEICRLIAEEGKTVRGICREAGMPAFRTVLDWVRQKPDFAEMYNQALRDRLDFFADQIIEIADDNANDWTQTTRGGQQLTVLDHEHIQRARLRIDTRKYLMSVGNPRRYSERLGTDEAPMRDHAVVGSDIERARRVVYILQQARKLAGPDVGNDAA